MDRPALPLPRASRRSRLPVRGVAVLAMASALFLSAAPAVSDDSATHPGQAQDAQEQTPVIVLVPLDTPEDWGSAIPDDPGILKRPVPATATGPASPEVRVRLDPDLGEWTDAVRAVVLASPSARIAEPAELETTSR